MPTDNGASSSILMVPLKLLPKAKICVTTCVSTPTTILMAIRVSVATPKHPLSTHVSVFTKLVVLLSLTMPTLTSACQVAHYGPPATWEQTCQKAMATTLHGARLSRKIAMVGTTTSIATEAVVVSLSIAPIPATVTSTSLIP